MGDIRYIEERLPHVVSECACLKCDHRWIDVRPVGTALKTLECPDCHKVGFVIETGEALEDLEVADGDGEQRKQRRAAGKTRRCKPNKRATRT